MIDFKNSKKIIFLIGGIALLFILILLFSRENNSLEYSSTFVQRGPIREEVSATGKIQPVGRIDLSFRSTGKVSKILVENGDKVKTGQVLAYLENDDLWAQLRQAQASLEAEIAQLNELKKGTREETINLKQIELSKAKQDLNNYYQTVTNTLNDAYAKSEEAIKIDTKDIFVGAEAGGGYKFSFDYCVTNEIASEATYLRLMSERELKQWKNEMAAINADDSFEELISAIQKAKNHLSVFNNFFNKLNNILMADCSYSNPHLDIHRVNANHGRNLIITALSNVGKLEDNIIALNFLVEKAENELDLLLAGSTPEQIAIQEARVKSAEANISNCYALLEKTIIRAPENGVIAKKNLREGETVAANTPVISIISSEEALEVRANIPEVDISKVQVGNQTLITLDAFPRQELKGEIKEIDLAETVIDGVIYYQVKSSFDAGNLAVKAGMTANLVIIVDSKEDALFIPRRAVLEREGKTLVRVPVKNEEGFEEKEIKTGIRSPEGNIEVLSGLEEGEEVITYINSNSKK